MREDWAILRTLFPQGWDMQGRDSGAVTRLRGFDSLEHLLRTLLMHVGCGWSLRETAARAKLAGIADVSDVTLLNRLRQSAEWLRRLCQQLWTEAGVTLELAGVYCGRRRQGGKELCCEEVTRGSQYYPGWVICS